MTHMAHCGLSLNLLRHAYEVLHNTLYARNPFGKHVSV